MKKLLLALSITIFATSAIMSQAPKFGYVNSQELLAEMPELKEADSELETYQKQLVAKGKTMVEELEAEYQKYVDSAQKGLLSQVQIQQKEAELGQKQQEIQNYELEVQQKLAKKRETLYQPILDRVKAAIQDYGKENGYTMIFDTSSGSLLHASESDNLLEQIKAKL